MSEPIRSDIAATIARVRELTAKASKGPWYTDSPHAAEYLMVMDRDPDDSHALVIAHIIEPADQSFIVEARTLLPRLADECERLAADNDRLRADAEKARRLIFDSPTHPSVVWIGCGLRVSIIMQDGSAVLKVDETPIYRPAGDEIDSIQQETDHAAD